MIYMHAVVAAFRIYAQRGEDITKTSGWRLCIKKSWNYIIDHGKSWKNHGIVFLNFCGNPVFSISNRKICSGFLKERSRWTQNIYFDSS